MSRQARRRVERELEAIRARGWYEGGGTPDEALAQAWGKECEKARKPVIMMLRDGSQAQLAVEVGHLYQTTRLLIRQTIKQDATLGEQSTATTYFVTNLPLNIARGIARRCMAIENRMGADI